MNDTSEKYLKALIEAIGRTKEEVAERVLRASFGDFMPVQVGHEHELEVEFDDK